MTDQEPLAYTISQAAAALQVSDDTVRSLIDAGRLPIVELSPRRRRIPAEALRRWLLSEAERSLNGGGAAA